MADFDFAWFYIIIFMAIPLARIIPRLLAKKGIGKNWSNPLAQEQFKTNPDMQSEKPLMESSKPQTKNSLVLGALNRGSKTFDSVQKNTGLDSQELDSILSDLEKSGMLRIVYKKGLLGTKTELYPTDSGFREYYS